MRRVRKRPVIVEAEQWEGPESLFIETLEGRMEARVGDWIITGIKGERYPCKPEIFEATYEILDESEER
jgi:hypothetical protein